MDDVYGQDERRDKGRAEPEETRELAHTLFLRYRRAVHGFFTKRRFSDQEARELTQEVFLRVLQNIGTLRREAAADAWLRRVVVNVWKNEIRRRRTQKRGAVEVSLEAERDAGNEAVEEAVAMGSLPPPNPLEEALEAEERDAVRTCLAALAPRMRRCLELHTYQERPYQEIAILLQVSTETVKSHIHQARQNVRRCLERKALARDI